MGIFNTSTGSSGDVLALKAGYTGTSAAGQNFITFFKGTGASIGAIQGNNAGSVVLAGARSDFAEWLPRLSADELVEPAEIVGVSGGLITKGPS